MSHLEEFDELVGTLPKPGERTAKRGANPETCLQKEIVRAIQAHGLWTVRLPGQGTLQQLGGGRAVLKPSGLAGFPDLLVIGPEGTTAWLEVKTPKGRPSALQTSRIQRLGALGHVAAIVRSADQAIEVLKKNGFIFCPVSICEARQPRKVDP